MENLHIHLVNPGWSQDGPLEPWVRGTVFSGDFKLHGTSLANSLPSAHASLEVWRDHLRHLNGFFSLICRTGDILVASVDRLRSMPLFFGQHGKEFYLSDDADWVRARLSNNQTDPVARDIFLQAGYVIGHDTLFPGLKQLLPGELLQVHLGTSPQLELHRWYTFNHIEPETWEPERKRQALAECVDAATRRLIAYADGRRIVVPLSGGYDSRLIMTSLKKHRYSNLLAFSYGTPGNKESRFSKQVAGALNVPWHFVAYDRDTWRKANGSPIYREHERKAGNWSSLPHVQDWLAVQSLVAEDVVDHHCVFAPGHCCVTGLIPETVLTDNWTVSRLKDQVMSDHFALRPMSLSSVVAQERISLWLDHFIGTDPLDHSLVASRLMHYNWQERQSKYIGNSVRAYESFGIDWWMPLWDSDLMSYWESVPLELRVDRKLYIGLVDTLYRQEGERGSLGNAAIPLRTKVRKYLPRPLVLNLKAMRDRMTRYASEPNPMHDRHPPRKSRKLRAQGYRSNGIAAFLFLDRLTDLCGGSVIRVSESARRFAKNRV